MGDIHEALIRDTYRNHTNAVVDSLRLSISEDLGELLRRLRALRGISQSELARRLEIAPAQVSQIEAGTYTPSLKVLELILNELDASLCVTTEEGVMFTDSSGLDLPPAPETFRVSPAPGRKAPPER